MLTHLAIKNFATVEALEIEFSNGLTTITGETGAGKSVMLDAIGLVSGARAQQQALRDEGLAAEITACFHCRSDSESAQWLEANDFDLAESDGEIIVRRIIRPEGRGRATINGTPVTLKQLSTLGKNLVDLHGQHEHHSLLRTTTHQPLLDNYSGLSTLSGKVRKLAEQAQRTFSEIASLSASNAENDAKRQLLRYQVDELQEVDPKADECKTLEAEQKKLANAETLLHNLNLAQQLCTENEDTASLPLLQRSLQLLQDSVDALPELSNAIELLESARIQIDEASTDIDAASSSIVHDPQRASNVESRLDTLYTLARKHNCSAHELNQKLVQLVDELKGLDNSDEKVEALEKKYAALCNEYQATASELSTKRKKAAKKLTKAINERLAELQMKHCEFAIALRAHEPSTPQLGGLETVEFLISTIPGKPPQPLAKVASGGELSRVSLAIQVVTASTTSVPTLVFDEVDVGIGGEVAAVVGNLLKALGKNCQVFCVTHLAQVAAKGDQHLCVSKVIDKSSATTSVAQLDTEKRKTELARMVSGDAITASTLAHASDLLEPA